MKSGWEFMCQINLSTVLLNNIVSGGGLTLRVENHWFNRFSGLVPCSLHFFALPQHQKVCGDTKASSVAVTKTPFRPVSPPASLATSQPVPKSWMTNPICAFHDVPCLPGCRGALFFSLAAQATDGVRRLCSTPGLCFSFRAGTARPPLLPRTIHYTQTHTHMCVCTYVRRESFFGGFCLIFGY